MPISTIRPFDPVDSGQALQALSEQTAMEDTEATGRKSKEAKEWFE